MQRGEHCSEFHGLLRELQRNTTFQEIELLREEDLVFQFSTGAKCNADEVRRFRAQLRPTPSTMLEATEMADRRI